MTLVLYDYKPAPSPRRARIFLAEKGIDYECVQVDLGTRAQLEPEFRAINPRCTVPALKLEDGSVLAENLAIAAYLDATFPEPPLMGATPLDRARVLECNARLEAEGLMAIAEALRNSAPRMKGRALTGAHDYDQIPELAERGRARYRHFLDDLDTSLEGRDFVVLDGFTFADITAFVVVDFGRWIKIEPEERHANVRRWFEATAQRPSASV
jgi:glutathione S-transferase